MNSCNLVFAKEETICASKWAGVWACLFDNNWGLVVDHWGHYGHWLLDNLWLSNELLDHLLLARGHLLDQNWLLLLDLRVHGQRRLEHWELKTGHDRLVDLWLGGDWGGNDSGGSDDFVSQWVLVCLEVLVDDVLDVIGVDDVHDRRSGISAHPCKGLTLVDHVDTSLSDDRAGSVSSTEVRL